MVQVSSVVVRFGRNVIGINRKCLDSSGVSAKSAEQRSRVRTAAVSPVCSQKPQLQL